MSAVCRSCGAAIRWERTVNDKPIPLDPEPREDGNLAIRDDGKVYHFTEGQGVIAFDPGFPLYVAHFATCPNASEHRR